MKDLLLYVHVVVTENLKFGSFTLSFDGPRQSACRSHSTIIFPRSTRQSIIDFLICRCRFRRRFWNSLFIQQSANGVNIVPAIGPFLIYCHIYCNMKGTCFPDMRKILATDELYKRNNVFYSLSFCQCAGKTQRGRVPCISLNSCCSSASWTWISSGNFEKVLFLLAFLFICCCCWCLSLISRLLGGNSVNDH